jgi:hypothetical protein
MKVATSSRAVAWFGGAFVEVKESEGVREGSIFFVWIDRLAGFKDGLVRWFVYHGSASRDRLI